MTEYEEMWRGLGLDVERHRALAEHTAAQFREQVLWQENRPRAMGYFDEVIHRAHSGRVREIIAHKEAGGKFIGTFCVYVPEEIAVALGVLPLALCGGTAFSVPYAERVFPRDMCPLVKSTLGLAFSKTCPYAPLEDMSVGETTCDAKKKTWDVLAERADFHVMEVPQKKSPRDAALWYEEVLAFKERLEDLTGKRLEADSLSEAVRLLNRRRRGLARLHSFRNLAAPPLSGLDTLVVTQAAFTDDAERFAVSLERLNQDLEERVARGLSVGREGAKRIMITGCPSVAGNWKLHHLLESSGALVVCDETCTGTRYFENLVPEADGDLEAQLRAIADRYLKTECACFSPNDERIESVLRLAEEYRVAGAVQYVLQYCHGYNLEAIRVASALKQKGIPSLKIETDYSQEDTGQLRTRIEAFLEML